jgi:SNF2 family DNA or RNA helicase
MSTKQKDLALSTFRSDPSVLVLLVSLKCGNVGLNLTCANRVILLGLLYLLKMCGGIQLLKIKQSIGYIVMDRKSIWSLQRDVVVNRITIPGTVEDRILELQKQKQEVIDKALGEGTGEMGNMRLNLQDLVHLFGHEEPDD